MEDTAARVLPDTALSSPSRLRRLLDHRFFLSSLVGKEFKVRYAQSFLGFSWMILEPLLMVLTLSTVFVMIGRKGPPGVSFPVYFYAGVLPWGLFRAAITDGPRVFLKDQNLLSKINYPREISILKEQAINLIEFFVASIAFFVVLAIYRHPPNLHWLYLPLLLGLEVLLSLGIMFLMASITVYIRDVGILMKTVGALWFWFTPVVFDFPLNDLTRPLFYLNPMVGIIKSFREVILYGRPPLWEFLLPSLIGGLILLVVGYWVFRRLERNFVDVL